MWCILKRHEEEEECRGPVWAGKDLQKILNDKKKLDKERRQKDTLSREQDVDKQKLREENEHGVLVSILPSSLSLSFSVFPSFSLIPYTYPCTHIQAYIRACG